MELIRIGKTTKIKMTAGEVRNCAALGLMADRSELAIPTYEGRKHKFTGYMPISRKLFITLAVCARVKVLSKSIKREELSIYTLSGAPELRSKKSIIPDYEEMIFTLLPKKS